MKAEDLFAAARSDAPTAAQRAAVWDRVRDAQLATPSLAPAAAKAALGWKAIAAMATVALAAAGVLAGSATTTREQPAPPRAPAVVVRADASAARLSVTPPRGRAPARSAVPASAPLPSRTEQGSSSLADEARLVSEARVALRRGEFERALSLAREAKRLPLREMDPERLSLEARALRVLGRTAEAQAAEEELRSRFPGHALAR